MPHGYCHPCCRLKFGIWLGVVVLLVLAIIGLSVTMAVLQSKRNKDSSNGTGPTPGVPAPPGGDPNDISGGGGGSSGNGFSGAGGGELAPSAYGWCP